VTRVEIIVALLGLVILALGVWVRAKGL